MYPDYPSRRCGGGAVRPHPKAGVDRVLKLKHHGNPSGLYATAVTLNTYQPMVSRPTIFAGRGASSVGNNIAYNNRLQTVYLYRAIMARRQWMDHLVFS